MILNSKNKKKFKIIGYISPVTFNFLALFTAAGWVPLIGGALAATANILADKAEKDKLINQYNKCVEKALESAKNATDRGDWIDLLNELSSEEGVYESLDDLIEKSDCFRLRYCTPKDAKEIIDLFEQCFIKEVATYQDLNNFYTLNNTRITLEKLKEISNIMNDNHDKINKMSNEVSKIGKAFDICESYIKKFTQRVGNSLIAFCCFILLGVVFKGQYSSTITLFLPLFFLISELIVEIAYERLKIMLINKELLTNATELFFKAIMQFFIVLALTYVSNSTFDMLKNEGLHIFALKIFLGLLFEKVITYFKSNTKENIVGEIIKKEVAKAKKEKSIEIAIEMIKDEISLENIARYSGLSPKEVKKIHGQNVCNAKDLIE